MNFCVSVSDFLLFVVFFVVVVVVDCDGCKLGASA